MLSRTCLRVGAFANRSVSSARTPTTTAPARLPTLRTIAFTAPRKRPPQTWSDNGARRPSLVDVSHHQRARSYSSTPAAAAAETPSEHAALEKPDFLDDAESRIWDLLAGEFVPTELQVRDISGGCGSMYGIEISSDKFRGVGVLKQQRMVNAVLGDMMKGWHGVQLKTKVPT